MSDRNGRNIDRLLEAVAFMMKAPRTVKSLAQVMDMVIDNVAYRYMERMHDHGLVYVQEWLTVSDTGRRCKPHPLYAWNPVPWQNPDVPAPERVAPPPGKRELAREARAADAAARAIAAARGLTT